LQTGTDIVLFTTGVTLPIVIETHKQLSANGLSVGLVHLPTVQPLDQELLRSHCHSDALWVSIEEHSVIGGLGGRLAAWLAEHHLYQQSVPRLLTLGSKAEFLHGHQTQQQARLHQGLTPELLAARIQMSLHAQMREHNLELKEQPQKSMVSNHMITS